MIIEINYQNREANCRFSAATVKIKIENICPFKSCRNAEKATKFILTARSISSIDISRDIMFFLLIKTPESPTQNKISATRIK